MANRAHTLYTVVIHCQGDDAEAEAITQALRTRERGGPEDEEDEEARLPPLRVGHSLGLATLGPYVLDAATGDVHAIYRLYTDTSHAFVRGVIPTYAAAYEWLAASDVSRGNMAIPFPSAPSGSLFEGCLLTRRTRPPS